MKKITTILLAVSWLIICTWLLTLPGSNLPKESWLDKIGADKIIHIVLFSILTWAWCMVFRRKGKFIFLFIALLSLAYGIAMEFVQRDYIPNRGFDGWDIVADAVGCLAGLYIFLRYRKK